MRCPLLLLLALVGCAVETPVSPTDETDATDDGGLAADGGAGDGGSDTAPVDEDTDDGGGDDTDSSDTGVPDEDDPSEYTYDQDEFEPTLDAEQVEAALDQAFALLLQVDPNDIFDSFNKVVDAGDSSCPYYYDYYYELYGYDYWYGGCTANNGAVYDGSTYGYDTSWDYGYYWYNRYGWWYGDFSADFSAADEPSGTFDMSGYVYFADYEYSSGSRYFSTSLTGAARSTLEDGLGTWMEQDLSLALTLSGGWYTSYGGYLDLSGGISGFEADVQSVSFQSVHLATAGWGSDCEAEPSGTISVRDDEGEWYEVMFDGPAYTGAMVFPPDCDGCGEVWWRGESLGMVCPDIGALLDWDGTPWEAQ
jgi:hypothetical protein